MTNIKINFSERAIEMTKKFERKAQRYGSDAYKELQEARRDYPSFRVVVKSSSRKNKDSFKGLTYEYMEKYIGNVFTGMVSSVVNWGLYVTLDNTVEGLVRFDDLPHDYYEIDETAGIIYGSNKSHIFKLGDIVRVKLIDVNQSKKQITFRMMRKLENE